MSVFAHEGRSDRDILLSNISSEDIASYLEPTPLRVSGKSVETVKSDCGGRLTANGAVLRAPSPDAFFELSLEERYPAAAGARGRPPVHSSNGSRPGRRDSKSPRPPSKAVRSRITAAWARNRGVLLVLLSQVFGTLMNVTTRLLEVEGNNGKGMHPFQILFARMGITVLLSSLYMWYKQAPDFPLGKKEVRMLLVARGLFGFFGVFGLYYSLLYLPLADAIVITFLAPSLACWACSFLINEPFTRMEQIAAYISLFGVVLIARPTALFSLSSGPSASTTHTGGEVGGKSAVEAPDFANYDNVTPQQRLMAVGMAMAGVIGGAGAYTTIRWIGKRAHALISVNYFAVWCTIVSIVMMLALPDVGFLLPRSGKEWGYLLFLGMCGFVMQFPLAAGLQHEKSSRATNMIYTQMLFALAFDKLVFGTTPSLLSIMGLSLILGSAIYVAVHKDAAAGSEPRGDAADRVGQGDEERGLVGSVDVGDAEELFELEEMPEPATL